MTIEQKTFLESYFRQYLTCLDTKKRGEAKKFVMSVVWLAFREQGPANAHWVPSYPPIATQEKDAIDKSHGETVYSYVKNHAKEHLQGQPSPTKSGVQLLYRPSRILLEELYVKSLGNTFSVDLKEAHHNNPQEESISVYSTLWKEKFDAASLKSELEAERETFTSEALYEHFTTMFKFWGQHGWYFHVIAVSSPVEGQAKSWCSQAMTFIATTTKSMSQMSGTALSTHVTMSTMRTECFLQMAKMDILCYLILATIGLLRRFSKSSWPILTYYGSNVSKTPEKYLNISVFSPKLLPCREPKDYMQIQLFQLWALILSTQSESSDTLPLRFTNTIKGRSVPNVTLPAPIPNVTVKKKKIADQFYVDEHARHLTSRSEHTPSSPSARSSSSDITPSGDNTNNAVTMDMSDTTQSLIYADKAEDVNQASAVDGQIQPKLVTTTKTAGPLSSLTLLSDMEQPTDITKNKCKRFLILHISPFNTYMDVHRVAEEDSVEQVAPKLNMNSMTAVESEKAAPMLDMPIVEPAAISKKCGCGYPPKVRSQLANVDEIVLDTNCCS
ncbi:hypothetical protein M422DRAFT_43592 [Sphaerobolus stellatus SS14]|nr:hypothetical protein M422DRAFT_43592 [Sphaerobolus stellatus SS14]